MRGVVVAAIVPAPAVSQTVTAAAKKMPKVFAAHPPFGQMIVEAISALQGKNGSSRQAILKYIKAHHEVGEKTAAMHLRRNLITGTAAGKWIQTRGSGASGSFKLRDGETVQVKPLPTVRKKPRKHHRKSLKPKRRTVVAVVPNVVDSKALGKRVAPLNRSVMVMIPRKVVGVRARLRTPAVKSTPKY